MILSLLFDNRAIPIDRIYVYIIVFGKLYIGTQYGKTNSCVLIVNFNIQSHNIISYKSITKYATYVIK